MKKEENLFQTQILQSMLQQVHYNAFKDVVELSVHVITPSYVTEEIKLLNDEALKNDISFKRIRS